MLLKTKSIKILFLPIMAVGIFNLQSFAQQTESPYSRYGFGDLNKGTFGNSFSLGNTTIGLRNAEYLNVLNPASYSSFNLTVFEAGLASNLTEFTADTISFITNSASFAYLGFGIPVTPWWGMSFGLLPFSSVGYTTVHSQEIEDLGTVTTNYRGSGGINKAYWGNGFKYKNISAGFNVSFLFGSITKDRRVKFDPNLVPFNTLAVTELSLRDFAFDFGLQYDMKLNENWKAVAGAFYSLRREIVANRQELYATYSSVGTADQIRDTVVYENIKGKIVLPERFGLGFSLERGSQWMIAADWKYGKWTDFSLFDRSDSLVNSNEFTLGIQYTPDITAVTDYFKTIRYRIGVRYNQSYLQLNNEQIQDIGITIGAGLPLRRTRSTMNIGFEFGQRGTAENNLIKERYINFLFGITINDRWFIKRKYD